MNALASTPSAFSPVALSSFVSQPVNAGGGKCNLMAAANQWANRPDDERFESLSDLHTAATAMQRASIERTIDLSGVRVDTLDGEVTISGQSGVPATLTHHAFGQLAQKAGAPSGYLRGLPAQLAADCLRDGLAKRSHDKSDRAYIYKNGTGPTLRAITSDRYARVFDSQIVERLMDLDGWKVPAARPVRSGQKGTRRATSSDVVRCATAGIGVREGDLIAPAGLYMSDHDLFCFMVDDAHQIQTPSGPLSRGFFCWNSEVGCASFGLATFLFDSVCGNHIVWGATQVKELRVRHVGTANTRAFSGLHVTLREYASLSANDDERKIREASTRILGAKKEDVVDAIFGRKLPGLTKSVLEDAYQIADRTSRYGDPNTVWGMVCGITEASQGVHADARSVIDTSAGKLLAF